MSDMERLDLTPDEYDRFVKACGLIALENGKVFSDVYEIAVLAKIHAGPFYGVVQAKMLKLSTRFR